MLSAEYSPAAGVASGARFCCAVSKITPLESDPKYHAGSLGSKAKRRSDHSEKIGVSGVIRPRSTRWKSASFRPPADTSFASVVVRTTWPSSDAR